MKRIDCQIENLENVTIHPDAFNDFNTDQCTLYVPTGKADAYRLHPVFGQFKDIRG